jgi:hypothetical protein
MNEIRGIRARGAVPVQAAANPWNAVSPGERSRDVDGRAVQTAQE